MSRPETLAEVVLARAGVALAVWPLTYDGSADLGLVDFVARLHLEARQAGCEIRLRDTSPALRELLELSGLAWLVEVAGQAEEPEQPGVEEVVVTDDPVT